MTRSNNLIKNNLEFLSATLGLVYLDIVTQNSSVIFP